MRQTDYDMSKAKLKLEEYDNDVQSVLMEYMGVNMQEKKKKKRIDDYESKNFQIYKRFFK